MREIVINHVDTELFLVHAERGLKKHYAERDWARLDEAIMELLRRFDLD